jgi:hypothetical protein
LEKLMVARKSNPEVTPASATKRVTATKRAAPAVTKRAVAGPISKKVGARPVAERAIAAATAKSLPIAEAAKPKHKLVRDSFTIPKGEYVVLQEMKARASGLKRTVKKSELLRAGIAVLAGLSDSAFLAALSKIPSLKTGRPKDSSLAT